VDRPFCKPVRESTSPKIQNGVLLSTEVRPLSQPILGTVLLKIGPTVEICHLVPLSDFQVLASGRVPVGYEDADEDVAAAILVTATAEVTATDVEAGVETACVDVLAVKVVQT